MLCRGVERAVCQNNSAAWMAHALHCMNKNALDATGSNEYTRLQMPGPSLSEVARRLPHSVPADTLCASKGTSAMLVIKRDGKKETVAFDKITARIKKLCYGFEPKHVDPVRVAQKVVAGVYDGVTTAQLDDLASETAAFLTTQHPDYGRLAARIAVSNLHKQTDKSFSDTM